jgi:hypothetical protein
MHTKYQQFAVLRLLKAQSHVGTPQRLWSLPLLDCSDGASYAWKLSSCVSRRNSFHKEGLCCGHSGEGCPADHVRILYTEFLFNKL